MPSCVPVSMRKARQQGSRQGLHISKLMGAPVGLPKEQRKQAIDVTWDASMLSSMCMEHLSCQLSHSAARAVQEGTPAHTPLQMAPDLFLGVGYNSSNSEAGSMPAQHMYSRDVQAKASLGGMTSSTAASSAAAAGAAATAAHHRHADGQQVLAEEGDEWQVTMVTTVRNQQPQAVGW
eukprot:scaffold77155_cov19-Tisochrysis_lutea.AAC.2